MFLLSAPLYELLAGEVAQACAGSGPLGERVVELDWEDRELLFRFSPCRDGSRLGFGAYRMETWCDGQRVSNNFDADWLRRLL